MIMIKRLVIKYFDAVYPLYLLNNKLRRYLYNKYVIQIDIMKGEVVIRILITGCCADNLVVGLVN